MAELDQRLLAAAAELEWPPTPPLELPAGAAARRLRPVLVVALAARRRRSASPSPSPAPAARSCARSTWRESRSSASPCSRRRRSGRSAPASARRSIAAAAAIVPGTRRSSCRRAPAAPTLRHRDGVVSTVLLASGTRAPLGARNGVGPYLIKKLVGGSTSVESVDDRRRRGVLALRRQRTSTSLRAHRRGSRATCSSGRRTGSSTASRART